MAHIERKMVPLYLTDQEKDQLDRHAGSLGVSRQKILEAIIESCLEDLDTMDKIGFLVSDVRITDLLNMFKNLTKKDINELARQYVEENIESSEE